VTDPEELDLLRREFVGILTCSPILDRLAGELYGLLLMADRMRLSHSSAISTPYCRRRCGDGSRCSPAANAPSLPRVVKRQEPVGVQTLRPELPVEGLDEGVARRLPRTGEVEHDVLLVGPEVEIPADELRP
jgi:hypothetical protein